MKMKAPQDGNNCLVFLIVLISVLVLSIYLMYGS